MIPKDKLEKALKRAELLAEYGYTEKSRNYWRGMRDTLKVILGITTSPPMVTGPDTDAAASIILGS